MKPYRDLKIGSLIQEELSKIILKDFGAEGALVTIVGVEISPDLLQAKIKLGVVPSEKAPEIFRALERRQKEFQHKLLKKINIKPMPQIRFQISDQK